MSWIIEDWRLKLLAFGLAILMLGAVAFSQNPPTRGTLTIGLNYDTASDIIILNPPNKTSVSYQGLADAIGLVNTSNLSATVDATHAKPGSAVKLNVNASTSVSGVQVINPVPIVVNIDTRATVPLTVTVKTTLAIGYQLKKPADTTCAGVTPCVIHFTGPVSWEDAVGLKAVVIYPTPIQSTEISQPSQPITLQTIKGPFDTTRVTQPSWSLDISSADIHILAAPGFTSNSVPLNALATRSPPSRWTPRWWWSLEIRPQSRNCLASSCRRST